LEKVGINAFCQLLLSLPTPFGPTHVDALA
jgi:hypothetical protein